MPFYLNSADMYPRRRRYQEPAELPPHRPSQSAERKILAAEEKRARKRLKRLRDAEAMRKSTKI